VGSSETSPLIKPAIHAHLGKTVESQMTDTAPRFTLEDFLPYQLAVASTRVSRRFERIYRERFGLTVPDWRVLAHLSGSGTVSVREIHQRVDMDKSKISRAATRLEDRGLINKRQHPTDRRLLELTLTDQGRTMVAEMSPLALAYQAELMAELGDGAEQFKQQLANLSKRST